MSSSASLRREPPLATIRITASDGRVVVSNESQDGSNGPYPSFKEVLPAIAAADNGSCALLQECAKQG